MKDKAIILSPTQEPVKINGKLSYCEGDQSWSNLRLKKEILHRFPQLKEKSSRFSYTMIVPKSQEEAKKSLQETKESVPILLFLCKETKRESN